MNEEKNIKESHKEVSNNRMSDRTKSFLRGIGLLALSWLCSRIQYSAQYLPIIEPHGGFYTLVTIFVGLLCYASGIAGVIVLIFAICDRN